MTLDKCTGLKDLSNWRYCMPIIRKGEPYLLYAYNPYLNSVPKCSHGGTGDFMKKVLLASLALRDR